ncbi:MAG: biotin--[acetyl-CoA-carboxylase] ligase [Cocleimonas sp.]
MPPKNLLNIDWIKASVDCGKIHYFESVNSTNSWLLKQGSCGDICISEKQTTGRGRRGNNWVSPEGNIYFSLNWCFDEIVEHWSLLGLVSGIAIAEALSDIGLEDHGVKWPNDIYWHKKKLGGILLETVDQSGEIIIGIGLNINIPDNVKQGIDQPITTLSEALKSEEISRDQLISRLIIRLQKNLKNFNQLNFDQFKQSWQNWDILQGQEVSFNHQGLDVTGHVVDIDKHGRLGVLKLSGERCFYSSADIKLTKSGVGK